MIYIIVNDWDDKTWCANNKTWVNDGRESAHFKHKKEAEVVFSDIPDEDKSRCSVDFYE